jgi:hypothetical protein
MEVVQGNIGPEASYSFKFEGGKLIAAAGYQGAELGVDLVAKYDAMAVVNALIDAVEKAIPGDQAALAAMLKGVVSGAVK